MQEKGPVCDITNTYHRSKVKGFDALAELALNISTSWYHDADKVWKQLDPVLWEHTHNPWIVLQTVSKEKLETTLNDPAFCQIISELVENNRKHANSPGWFQQNHPKSLLNHIAYFSLEYMLCEGLPIYSGGLGNVAGDQLKAASDLGVPVTAIGLLYQQGYFRQVIGKDGTQNALYPFNDPGQLPITPLRKANGEWLRLEVLMPGYSIWIRTWQVQVGRVKLYLLDSNDAANFPAHRAITSELYGGGLELRLQQEILLGMGGWRLLEALGIKPEVCHLNEGHAAFVVLERARSCMEETGLSFEVALTATRAGNLFTTHTAVPAGFDCFPTSLIEQYLSQYAIDILKIPLQQMLSLGRQNPDDPNESFNMAYLAVRGSGAVNGVSRLHGDVSRHIFSSIFPHWPINEVPIGYVTNGVHMPSWDFEESDNLWTQAGGKSRWLETTECLEKKFRTVSDIDIWKMRNAGRKKLIEYTRKKFNTQLALMGSSHEEIEKAKHLFDPNILTLGFARRFATYKRPNLLLHNPERLIGILKNPRRPAQLLIAGKAHPKDLPGQAIIKQWINFIKTYDAQSHIIFLSDYDILISEHLVQGVDVWINNPRRPWEACGTSGMKILVNGGLNLSELDGWWAEAFTPDVGWALGDGNEHGEDQSWDAAEADTLYDILEHAVAPAFYERDSQGLPTAWIAKIRESMATLTPQFSSNRTVREYTEKYYLPAASAYLKRIENNGALGKEIYRWQQAFKQDWPMLHFDDVHVETKDGHHLFKIGVHLNGLEPSMVKVELYVDEKIGPFTFESTNLTKTLESHTSSSYQISVPATRPASDYTPRITPAYSNASIPLEFNQIIWQH